MIATFTKILPYIFLLYFVIRSLKEPIYLLGIPFLIFLRFSIFFENVKIFEMPGSITTDIRLLSWLFVFWLIIRIRHLSQLDIQNINFEKKSLINLMDYVVMALMIISIIDLIMVQREYYILDNIFTEFISLFSLFLGYFIIKDIVRRFSSTQLEKFLFSLVLVNSIASFLYIIHQGLHFAIYQGKEYSTEFFQGELITRTFWFMPVLCFFSISYLFVFNKEKSVISYILLGLNILALFISYTRSFVIIIMIIAIIYYVLDGYKNKNLSKISKNLILAAITGLLLFLAVSKFLPNSTEYFMGRFTEIKENPNDESSNSIIYRLAQTSRIIDKINEDKLLIGFGPVTEIQLPLVEVMRITTFDIVWMGVVFRWGYIGLALFGLLYTISIIKAFGLFIKRDGVLSQLGLVFLLTILSQIIESFVSSTFLADNRLAMGFWYLAILTALVEISEKKESLIGLESVDE